MDRSDTAPARRIPLWALIVCLAPLVIGIGDHALWTPDEPRVAEVARAMAEDSAWLVPQLAGKPFVEKPPLYFWLAALSMLSLGKVVGATAAARAASSICAALTLLVCGWSVSVRLGRQAALAAVLVLATMAGFFHASHWIIVDPLLMLLTTSAVLLLFTGLDRESAAPVLAAYFSAGLAFLTKGFVAGALIGIPWLIILIQYRRRIARRPLLYLAGLAMIIIPVITWMAAFYIRGGPDVWREWFIDNQLGRFIGGGTDLGHIRGPFYYLGPFPIAIIPWTPVIIGWVVYRRWREKPDRSPSTRSFLRVVVGWTFGGILLLSLSSTKRDIYLFPLLPGFAILASVYTEGSARWVRAILYVLCGVMIAAMAFFSFAALYWEGGDPALRVGFDLRILLCAAGAALVIFRCRRNSLVAVAAVTALFYVSAVFAVVPLIDRYKNYEPGTRLIAGAVPPESRERVCGWDIDETTRAIFLYYTGLALTEERDEDKPEESLERLQRIVDGEDPRYDYVISLTKKRQEFPPEGLSLDPVQLRTKEKMGINRTLYLVESSQ